ncbi:hypothetical protein B0H67DRAFT_369066 [Lasiosphaeris hirsuta]|uniref:EKC/KEOPS complex subunit GON7 n=1 Tax=Lasiosphaeris hirsuta TaxID=260670 RepID=A0AA39ZWS7_9PEZI|nr:hypothetical protein B0H67DRAFT_369066 [Lasiosphaeris hirsuta]
MGSFFSSLKGLFFTSAPSSSPEEEPSHQPKLTPPSPPESSLTPAKMPDQPNGNQAEQQQQQPLILSAVYTSGTGNEPLALLNPVNPPPCGTEATAVEIKSAYLSSLRGVVLTTQDQINKELTARMGEDNLKVQELSAAKDGNRKVIDDAKEEENYGEVVEED